MQSAEKQVEADMARGRMINQKITKDLDFNEMSIDAQFLFMRTIPYLDRDGLVTGHPTLLLSSIAPLLPQFAAKITSVIDEWISTGFVVKYMDGKMPVLFFKGFHKNQSLTHYERESASEFAPPPGYLRTPKGIKPVDDNTNGSGPNPKEEKLNDSSTPDQLRTNSGPTPDQLATNANRIEEKEKGKDNTRETEQAAQPATVPPHSLPSNSPTGDPYMDIALKRQQDRQANNGRHQAKRVSLWPDIDKKVPADIRLPLVERLIDIHGLRAAVDIVGDDAKLADMHSLAADLYVMGFKTLADIEAVYERFKEEWKGKTPAGRQLVTIASAMVQAKQPEPAKPKQQITFKRWLLDKHGCDNPQFLNIPRMVLDEQYNQYCSQQTH